MQTKNSIHFTIGEEFTPKVERVEDFPTSYFKDIYKKVFPVVEQITLEKPSEELNNIIAFIGDRGSGKTSCMRSVANVLINQHGELVEDRYLNAKADEHVYQTIDLIDPSFFEEKTNILEITIAKMFTTFRKYAKENEQDCYDAERVECKRQLIEAFQQVKEDIDQLCSDTQGESLDTLISKAAALNLKGSLRNLVHKYLAYFRQPEGTLILMVDDLDLHTSFAYQMVEQIRKYLMLPNVLICMAVKLEQLKYIIKKHFAYEFQILNQKGSMDDLLEAMSERYLEKLIPHERRFYLPDLEVNFYRSLVIHRDANDKEGILYNSIREAVLTLIFKKTRFLFYNTKGKTSYIVPRNLRELRTIISLLFNMQDYWEGNVRPEYNKQLFLKYIFETWIPNNLSKENQRIVYTLNRSDVVNRNKVLIDLLGDRLHYNDSKMNRREIDKSLDSIVDVLNKPYNISIADIQLLLNELELQNTDSDNYKLIFAIKTLYSIWLYKYYDEQTEIPEIDKANIPEVFKSEFMADTSNYIKLIGGSFIDVSVNELIPAADFKSNSRANRVINGNFLNTIISKLNEAHKNGASHISLIYEENGVETEYSIDFDAGVQMVEFFALMVSRIRDDKRRPYRMLNEIYYDFGASLNHRNYYFDIMSCMFNLLDIPKAYARFDNLVELEKHTSESLYKSFQNKYSDRLASKVSIRNMEVLDEFTLHLNQKRPKGSSNDIEVLYHFFDSAGEFEIFTYDEETDELHYKIAFEFLKDIFADWLKKVANDSTLSKIFNGLYSDNLVKPELNINIGLYETKNNSAQTILKKLDQKNPRLAKDPEYLDLTESLFTKEKYSSKEAVRLLQTLQKRLNG